MQQLSEGKVKMAKSVHAYYFVKSVPRQVWARRSVDGPHFLEVKYELTIPLNCRVNNCIQAKFPNRST